MAEVLTEPYVITEGMPVKENHLITYEPHEKPLKHQPVLDLYVKYLIDGESNPRKKLIDQFGERVGAVLKKDENKKYIADKISNYCDIDEDRMLIYNELKAIAHCSVADLNVDNPGELDKQTAKAVQAIAYNRETGELQLKFHNKLQALAQLAEIVNMGTYTESSKPVVHRKRLFDEDL